MAMEQSPQELIEAINKLSKALALNAEAMKRIVEAFKDIPLIESERQVASDAILNHSLYS